MVHVLAPRPALSSMPVFYNVDAAVGRNAPNSNMEDILLIQYMLSVIGKFPSKGGRQLPELVHVPVTGLMNPQTIAAIEAVQRADNVQPDGRVSSARNYKYGAKYYTVVILNFNLCQRFRQKWPNMGELPGCPHQLNVSCRRALAGVE